MNKSLEITFDLTNQEIKTEDLQLNIAIQLNIANNQNTSDNYEDEDEDEDLISDYFNLISHSSVLKYNENNTMIYNEKFDYSILNYFNISIYNKAIDSEKYNEGTIIEKIIFKTDNMDYEEFQKNANLIDDVIKNLKNKKS